MLAVTASITIRLAEFLCKLYTVAAITPYSKILESQMINFINKTIYSLHLLEKQQQNYIIIVMFVCINHV